MFGPKRFWASRRETARVLELLEREEGPLRQLRSATFARGLDASRRSQAVDQPLAPEESRRRHGLSVNCVDSVDRPHTQ